LENFLEVRGFELAKQGETPDFIATANTEPVEDGILEDANRKIAPLASLRAEANSTNYFFSDRSYFQIEDSMKDVKHAVSKKQKSVRNTQSVSVIAFDGKNKENIFYGITRSDGYSFDPSRFRQSLMQNLLRKSIPSSKIGSTQYISKQV
jgi:hypothetical protein